MGSGNMGGGGGGFPSRVLGWSLENKLCLLLLCLGVITMDAEDHTALLLWLGAPLAQREGSSQRWLMLVFVA